MRDLRVTTKTVHVIFSTARGGLVHQGPGYVCI
jgi:hypothetical protein